MPIGEGTNAPPMRLTFRNPSRRYIESLEARVTALEAIVNAIRNANSDSLPDIVREIRSGRDDIEYYAPLSMLPSRAKPDDSHEDAPSAPLQELGKIMGSLQLEEGQVSRRWECRLILGTILWTDFQFISCLN